MQVQPATSDPRYLRLVDLIRPLEKVVVAYSGGVDSTLVVKAAADALGSERILAATGVSDSLAPRELESSRGVLAALGLERRQRLVETAEQQLEAYRRNQPDRCFHCKTELYSRLRVLADREGYRHVADGTNRDDLDDFRPGQSAAAHFGVKSPLLEAELGKADVRALAAALSLPNRDKPAAPCLASRIPHGSEVNPGKLMQIAQAEAYLHDLGLRDFRVRHHGDVARIEIDPGSWDFFSAVGRRLDIERAMTRFGFRFVALDLGGYRRGKAVVR